MHFMLGTGASRTNPLPTTQLHQRNQQQGVAPKEQGQIDKGVAKRKSSA